MPTIMELIRGALDGGRTVRQLQADSGHRVKHQTFQELSKAPPDQFPRLAKTITGMSEALRVPEATIVLAYAKGLGWNVNIDSAFALRLPPGVDDLDPSMQDAIIHVARAALHSGAGGHPVAADERENPVPDAVFGSTDGRTDAGDSSEAAGEDRRYKGGP
jgi:hypothetical protein